MNEKMLLPGKSQSPFLAKSMSRTNETMPPSSSTNGLSTRNSSNWTADVEAIIQQSWNGRFDSKYTKVEVLTVRWEKEDLYMDIEYQTLAAAFSDNYLFTVYEFRIPDLEPSMRLTTRIVEFLSNANDETLHIFYYSGHGNLMGEKNESHWIRGGLEPNVPSFPSGPIQALFEYAESDSLLIFDACCSAAAPVIRNSRNHRKGITELISACGFDNVVFSNGCRSFTAILAEILKGYEHLEQSFSIADLHVSLLSRAQKVKGSTPVLSTLKDKRDRSIVICPSKTVELSRLLPWSQSESTVKNTSPAVKPSAIVNLSMLVDDSEQTEEWKEWVLKAPKSVKSITSFKLVSTGQGMSAEKRDPAPVMDEKWDDAEWKIEHSPFVYVEW